MSNFKKELQLLVEINTSEKIKKVQRILKTQAAKGNHTCFLEPNQYDEWVIKWLEANDLDTKEIYDPREGNLRVSWKK